MADDQYVAQHVFDALPSSPDRRDRLGAPIDLAALPDISLLPQAPFLNQGNEGACVGHGCAAALETLELIAAMIANLANQTFVALSRKFIYYEARLLEGTPTEDSGAEVRDGCKVMNQMGVCTEEQFPYHAGDFADVPPDLDVTAAAQHKIASYTRLTTSNQVRASIAAQHPVVIGVQVYQSFEQNVGADGIVPMPDKTKEQLLGGHCMYINGYKPNPAKPGKFLFRTANSWGPDWADHGACWLDEDYLNDGELCSDLWSIALT